MLNAPEITEKTQLEKLAVRYKPVNELHRFALLLLGLYAMICCSFGSYIFNLVSGSIQSRYGYDQGDVTVISTCGMVVGYVMLPYGVLYDFFGPLPVAILSVIVFPLGALLMGLTFQNVITASIVKLCVFYTFMNLGTSFYDLTACMTLLAHFPTNRGAVIALLKTFVGLGGAIVGSFYTGFFNSKPSPMLYTLMGFAIFIATLMCFFMKFPEYQLTGFQERVLPEEEKKRRLDTRVRYLRQKPPTYRFLIGFVILVFLIIFLPLTSALAAYLPEVNRSKKAKLGFAIVVLVFVVGFSLIAFPFPGSFAHRQYNEDEDEEVADGHPREEQLGVEPVDDDGDHYPVGKDTVRGSALADDDSTSNSGSVAEAEKTELDFIAPQYQTSFWHNLLTPELWCIWWTVFCVVGTEMMIMNNSSNIMTALRGKAVDNDLRALLSVLNGVGSAVGRLLMSGFEIWTQKKPADKRIPITICLFFPTTSVIITLVLLLALPGAALPLPYVTAAIGNGFLAASQILVTKTIYAKDSAKHYHICFLATSVSSIVINRFLYGEWYTVRARKYGQGNVCLKRGCVQMPLIVCMGLACSAFLSNVVIHLRYRFYSKKVLSERARLRHENATEGNNGSHIEDHDLIDPLNEPDRSDEIRDKNARLTDEKKSANRE